MPRHHGTRHATIAHPYLVPAWRVTMTRTSLTGTSATVTKDASVQNGDLLIACIGHANAEAITEPTGWTLIQTTEYGGGQEFRTYYKIAATEGASWVWSWSSSVAYNAFVVAYSGIDPVRPLHTVTSNPLQSSSVNSVATGLTPDARGSLVVTIHVCVNNRTFTAPTGMTERADVGSGPSSSLHELVPSEPIATGSKTATLSSANGSGAQMIAFRPRRVGLPG
jgi:hypothetical protein